MTPQRLLIGYDGSDDAGRAIAVAADALHCGPALILTIWDALRPAEAAMPLGGVPHAAGGQVPISQLEREALATAREGADLARDAGLNPEFDIRDGSGVHGIADGLVDAADSWGADVIVIGRRDMSRLREIVLGSVSDIVLRDSPIPVLAVPVPREG